jgi:hypothetical protein
MYMSTRFLYTTSIITLGVLFTALPFALHAAGLVPCDGVNEKCNVNQLIVLVQKILGFFSIIVPFIAAALFAWGGILYMTAQGDTGKIANAHKLFGYAAFGLVITLAAWLIVFAILSGLNVDTGFWLIGRVLFIDLYIV